MRTARPRAERLGVAAAARDQRVAQRGERRRRRDLDLLAAARAPRAPTAK